MKFFHLSDLHIGAKLVNRDIREDQNYILDEICRYAREQQPDAVLIAGDVYDKSIPSAEAVEMLDRFIRGLNEAAPETELMVISGNHDNGIRLNAFRSVLQHHKIHMIGLPPESESEHIETVRLEDEFGLVNFYLLPFVKPSMVKAIAGTDENGNNLSYDASVRALIARENIDESQRNVLVSHQFYLPVGADAGSIERMDSEIQTVGNIDEVKADILNSFDYAALGHIHKPMAVGNENYRYCGTPMAYSISEAGQKKGILQISMDAKGQIRQEVLPLVPEREVRKLEGTMEDLLKQSCEDFVSILITDPEDLVLTDMHDRINHAFPNVLQIRRKTEREVNYTEVSTAEELLDTYRLCEAFLEGIQPEEKVLLQEVINTVRGEQA